MKRLESLTNDTEPEFPEYDAPPAVPGEIASTWMKQARNGGVREPEAMTLATCNKDGHIAMRVMCPVCFDGYNLLFATHSTSRKGHDIAQTHSAGGHYYWRELGRQLFVSGVVGQESDQVADQVWNARDAAYDPVSTISWQSAPLRAESTLAEKVAHMAHGKKLPRPERFVVYRLAIDVYEFWSASRLRLHKRLRYKQIESGWEYERLQP